MISELADPLVLWGWGTPAGQLRAERRAALIAEGAGLVASDNGERHLLEIGCGNGFFTEKFSKYGARILAVDISPEILALARQRNLPDKITFLEAPFEECAIHGPFDAIIGSSILHHLDCRQAMPKIFSLLKPGGRFSFCEPNMLNPQVWFTLRFRRFFPHISPDETAFTKRGMTTLLRDAGFTDIKIVPFDWLHPSLPKKTIPFVKRCEKLFLETLPGVREFSGSLWCTAERPFDNA